MPHPTDDAAGPRAIPGSLPRLWRHPMLRIFRYVLPVAALALGGALWAAAPSRGTAAASLPAPGELDLLGKNGQIAGRCPLKHTDVQAEISGFVSRVTVRQEFQNTATEP